jgi:L,D-transpeptidase YcbB
MPLRSIRILAGFLLLLLWPVFGRPDAFVRAESGSGSTSSEPIPEPQKLSPGGEASLQDVLNAALLPDLHKPNFANYRKDATAFYVDFGDALPWLDQGKPTAEARAVIRALQNSAYKGLRPEDYDGPLWDARLAKFDGPGAIPESDLLKFDLALTICAMRYVSDLHMGRVNPQLFHFGLDIDHQQISLSDFLSQKLVGAADAEAVLTTVEPPFPIYPRTQAALKKYIEFARIDDGEPLPASSRPVKPGDSYPGVQRLAKLLTLLGDLPPENAAAFTEGSYQGALVDAVKHFQRRHGLAPNAILDSPTLKELNTPLARRVTQLQLAMERMRWLPHQFSRPPVIVNIPEFRLYGLNEQYLTAFTMNVVVGKAYGHQTPVFANEIRSVVFRPYWNVPQSIVDAEMIPKLKKDSSYLSKNSLELLDKDEKVVNEDPASVETLAQLRAGKLRIRQTPGPENSLGLVKFEFPNQYSIYMHSTPAKELFSRTRRDFSHGCIRLEDPPKMADWVLQGMPEWTDEHIRAVMNGDETVQVRLKDPIPVLIFYSTAVVLEGEEPHFFEDIYGLDADLEKGLALNPSDSGGAELSGKR